VVEGQTSCGEEEVVSCVRRRRRVQRDDARRDDVRVVEYRWSTAPPYLGHAEISGPSRSAFIPSFDITHEARNGKRDASGSCKRGTGYGENQNGVTIHVKGTIQGAKVVLGGSGVDIQLLK
jgi:hypothetical protein